MSIDNIKSHEMASRECREGKEEDSELCPGTFQHYDKKEAAKENKKEKIVKKVTKKVVSKKISRTKYIKKVHCVKSWLLRERLRRGVQIWPLGIIGFDKMEVARDLEETVLSGMVHVP